MENTNKKTRKFNIVDVIIIAVVIAALAILVYKVAGKKIVESTDTKTFYVTYTQNELAQTTAECVKLDDVLTDFAGDVPLGKVVDVYVDPHSHSVGATADGGFTASSRPGFNYISIVGEVSAVKKANGISINGNTYLVGHSMTLEAGDAKIYVLISGISETKPSAKDVCLRDLIDDTAALPANIGSDTSSAADNGEE